MVYNVDMKKRKKSFGQAVAAGSALAGAALGAAAVILSDKKNQEKIKKTVDDISREAVVIGKKIKKKADEFTKKNKKNKTKKAVKSGVKTIVKKATKKSTQFTKKK